MFILSFTVELVVADQSLSVTDLVQNFQSVLSSIGVAEKFLKLDLKYIHTPKEIIKICFTV